MRALLWGGPPQTRWRQVDVADGQDRFTVALPRSSAVVSRMGPLNGPAISTQYVDYVPTPVRVWMPPSLAKQHGYPVP